MTTIKDSELFLRPRLYSGTAEAVRAAVALRTAQYVRIGPFGRAYIVTCDREAAAVIADYCRNVGGTFAVERGLDQGQTRAKGRALLRVAVRILDLLSADS